jgi:hypothetical protein
MATVDSIFIPVADMEAQNEEVFSALEEIETAIENADIDYTIDNDGIGPYEYWGARCYDHGTDYFVVEGWEEINIAVCVENYDPAELNGETFEKWARELLCDVMLSKTVSVGEDYGAEVEASLVKIAEEISGTKAVIVFAVEWDSDGVLR